MNGTFTYLVWGTGLTDGKIIWKTNKTAGLLFKKMKRRRRRRVRVEQTCVKKTKRDDKNAKWV